MAFIALAWYITLTRFEEPCRDFSRLFQVNMENLSDMKKFEELFGELKAKAAAGDPESGTVRELAKGKHFVGKKIVEEAGEVWIAAEYEGKERTAEEISQLIYHLQVMMIANDIELDDIYKYL